MCREVGWVMRSDAGPSARHYGVLIQCMWRGGVRGIYYVLYIQNVHRCIYK